MAAYVRQTSDAARAVYRRAAEPSGVAKGWTGVDMSTPLLLEVAPEIHTNPTSFYRAGGLEGGRFRLQTPVIGSRPALAMSVHPTYFDLAAPLAEPHCSVRGGATLAARNLSS